MSFKSRRNSYPRGLGNSPSVVSANDKALKPDFSKLQPLDQKDLTDKHHDEFQAIRNYALQMKTVKYLALFQYTTGVDILLLIIGTIFAVASGLAFPFTLYLFALYFREVSEVLHSCTGSGNNFVYILHTSMGLAASSISSYICFFTVANRQIHKIRLLYFEALLRKDSTWYDCILDRNLSHRLIEDIGEIGEVIGRDFSYLISGTVSSLAMVGLSFWISWQISLLAYAVTPIIACVMLAKSRYDKRFVSKNYDLYAKADEIAMDVLSKIRTTKLLKVEDEELERYVREFPSVDEFWKIIFFLSLFSAMQWILVVAHNLMLTILGIFVSEGVEPCSDDKWDLSKSNAFDRTWAIISFTAYVTLYAYFVTRRIDSIRRAKYLAAQIFFTIKWNCYIDNFGSAGAVPVYHAAGNISFRSVSFSYPRNPEKITLKKINCTIYSGQMVTFFGPPGSGKGTLLKVMMRLYDATNGKVMLDGRNIQYYNVPWLRSQFAVVSSNPVVLHGTIAENISLGSKETTMDEITSVCVSIGFHSDILDFPEGYDTYIGFRSGLKLTATQLKKLALAQVLIKKSKILIMDDFISSLDQQFENTLLQKLLQLQGRCTIILTTDRFSSIVRSCDVVFAMREGKVVQSGNHYAMIKQDGWYSKILEESLEYKAVAKPAYYSQIRNFNFAQTITRMHEQDDEKIGNLMEDMEEYKDSILLRHDLKKNYRKVQPRIFGGINGYIPLSIEYEGFNFRGYLQSDILRKRDLRRKLQDLQDHRARYGGGGDSESLDSAKVSQPHFERAGNRASKTEMGTQFLNSTKKGPKKLSVFRRNNKSRSQHSYGGLIPTDRTSNNMPEKEHRKGALAHNRMFHYNGWILNSSFDKQTLTSTESAVFWNVYSKRLIHGVEREESTGGYWKQFLLCARFSWIYCLIGAIISIFSSYCAIELTEEWVSMASSLLAETTTVAQMQITSYYSVRIVGWTFVLSCAAFIQELFFGTGFFYATGRMRAYLLKYYLSLNLEWYRRSENDVGFLCESLYADTASVQTGLFSLAVTGTSCVCIVVLAISIIVISMRWFPDNIGIVVAMILLVGIRYGRGYLFISTEWASSGQLRKLVPVLRDVLYNLEIIQFMGISRNVNENIQRLWQSKESILFDMVTIFLKSVCFGLSDYVYFICFAVGFSSLAARIGRDWTTWKNIFEYSFLTYYVLAPLGFALSTLPHRETRAGAIPFEQARVFWKDQENLNYHVLNVHPTDPPPHLYVRRLNFAYRLSPRSLALKAISFDVPPTSYYAICGSIESGRTPLMDILNGQLIPTAGDVFINDISINEIEPKCFAKIIGYAEQDPCFWDSKSVKENIIYGSAKIGESNLMYRVKAAAKLSMLADKIAGLIHGYDTLLKDLPASTDTLVFRQLLAIARLAFQNPKIVIINDLTVSVDDKSDALLLQALGNLRVGRTLIISSTRIEPIRKADCILVLHDGKIVEQGTDFELMQLKGAYYEQLMAQKLFEASAMRPQKSS